MVKRRRDDDPPKAERHCGREGPPKYDPEPDPPAPPTPSERERKFLARLVRKYGRASIIDIASTIDPAASSGRPRRDLDWEAAHLADWIDEATEDHRQANSPHPVTDAWRELYEMEFEDDERAKYKAELDSGARSEDHFEVWRKNLRRKLPRGRRALQHARDVAAKMERMTSRRTKGRK